MTLQYLTYQQIDKKKWDACINASINKLIYAESSYLDRMAQNWDAIVLNDYEAVMPLIWKKKFGIRYLYQPAFFQQGGVFITKRLNKDIISGFISSASEHFRFAEITVNFLNKSLCHEGFYSFKTRNNYIFHLGKKYESLARQYSVYIKQRLKRLEKYRLQLTVSTDHKKAIAVYRKLYKDRLPDFRKKDYENFEAICGHYARLKRLYVREVWDSEGKSLLACVVLLRDENRIYNIASSVFPEGKKLLANYFLYDAIIREFAEEKLVLDFEGSDVPGIAYFYKNWATENQQYPFIRWNLLPSPIKFLKR